MNDNIKNLDNIIKIIDIYWDRIYLNIILKGNKLSNYKYFISTSDNKKSYPIELNNITHSFKINITNIKDSEMLSNNQWYIKYNYKSKWIDIPITNELGYKLKDLDKIYRYGGNSYAYIISFSIKDTNERMYCQINTTFMMRNLNPHKRYFKIESNKIKKRITNRIVYYSYKFIDLIYQIVSHLTSKKGNKILLMSEARVPISGNLAALDKRMKERQIDKNFKITYYFCKTITNNQIKKIFAWLKLAIITAKQDYIFIDDYSPFFKYINPNPKTKLIQVWHAGVGFKSVGYGRFGEQGSPYPYDAPHKKYTYAVVGSKNLKEVYAEAFGINEDQCLPYGLMRLDNYMNQEQIDLFKKAFYNLYPQFKEKKIILFAPTFRGQGENSAYYPQDKLDQDKIYEMCDNEYVFLIKMHPFVKETLIIQKKYQDKIIDFTSYPDINELFYITDILITDYSSNIYEFSLHKKPIIFYDFDKEEYELTRGVHRSINKYSPGKICYTIDEVINTIKNEDFETEKLYKFIEENFEQHTGNAADKVIDNIILKDR